MTPKGTVPQGPAAKEAPAVVNPYEAYDREIPVKNKSRVAVCRLLKFTPYLQHNSKGDRISIEPAKARWLEKQGIVVVEIASVCPVELKAAGGVEAYLKANPKEDLLSTRQRAKIGPIPGIPDPQAVVNPWDLED